MEQIINRIHNCDNQDILKQLPDKSVQVFLEDMPYGITACKWDKMPDLKEYWELRLSKIKDNGCFVLFGSEPFASYLRMSNIKMFKYDWVWCKNQTSGFALVRKQPLRNHETISVFYKKQCIYNPIKEKRCLNEKSEQRFNYPFNSEKGKNEHQNNIKKVKYTPESKEFSYPKTVKNFNCIYTYKRIHPTQKPIDLFEYFIKTYSNEGDLIFDGFSGSGTTASACKNLNRQYICCENNNEYYNLSIERQN
jgi:site-specific DNA-methyltransferase (adenine-specific)